MTQIPFTTLPATCGTGGTGGGDALSFPDIEQTIFVDKGDVTGLEDGTQQYPFHTVDDAITAAVALTPGAANQIAVYVYPGIYTENNDLELPDYVHLVGMCRDACVIQRTVVAAVTDPVLLVSGAHCTLWNLSFWTAEDARVVRWATGGGGTNYCSECRFLGGGGGAEEYCFVDGDSTAVFVDCVFENADVSDSTFRTDTTGGVRLVGCELSGYVQVDDGDFDARKCSFTTDDQPPTIGVLAVVDFYLQDCVVENSGGGYCLVFYAELTDVVLLGNRFSAGGSYDIASTSTIVGAQVKGNSMTKGMDGNISTASLERWSTGQAGDCDYYAGLFDALSAVDQDDVVIRMLDDEVFADSIDVKAYRTTLDLRGHKISRANRALVLNLNQGAGTDLTVLNGEVEALVSCFTSSILRGFRVRFDCRIGSASGHVGAIVLDRCHCEPAANSANAIRLGQDSTSVLFRRCFVKGQTGTNNGAIDFQASCSGVEAKYSTFSNGDGTNDPFERPAAETPTVSMYQCGFNAAVPAWITNNIAAGQEQSSVDANTDFA